MDEPFAALDAHTRASVRHEFLSIWDDESRRKTVLFVTHDLTEALILADRVLVILAGTIVTDVDLSYERPRELGSLMTRTDVRALYHDLERAMDPRSGS
jgi:ABC-type nitrate/sulfonate/bicarbonate transport system ATPase subunit